MYVETSRPCKTLAGLQLLFLFSSDVHGDIEKPAEPYTPRRAVPCIIPMCMETSRACRTRYRPQKAVAFTTLMCVETSRACRTLQAPRKTCTSSPHQCRLETSRGCRNLQASAKIGPLPAPMCRGDIESLQNLTRPRKSSAPLAIPNVRGDVKSLRNLAGLEAFVPSSSTYVRGDIENLQNLTGLKEAVPSPPPMCVETSRTCRTLQPYRTYTFRNTGAQGHIDALLHFPSLEVALATHGTGTTGWISSTWNGRCKKLRELQLAARALVAWSLHLVCSTELEHVQGKSGGPAATCCTPATLPELQPVAASFADPECGRLSWTETHAALLTVAFSLYTCYPILKTA